MREFTPSPSDYLRPSDTFSDTAQRYATTTATTHAAPTITAATIEQMLKVMVDARVAADEHDVRLRAAYIAFAKSHGYDLLAGDRMMLPRKLLGPRWTNFPSSLLEDLVHGPSSLDDSMYVPASLRHCVSFSDLIDDAFFWRGRLWGER